MIGAEILARLREQASLIGANAVFDLLFACRLTEIRGGSANIVDVSLEIGHFRNFLGFRHA